MLLPHNRFAAILPVLFSPPIILAMFSPAIGIVEDPVTGNANGPMGVWLVHHNVLPHDGNVLCVKGHQGRALGRDGMIEVTVTIRDNQPEKVTISGTAVILFHAEWAIEL